MGPIITPTRSNEEKKVPVRFIYRLLWTAVDLSEGAISTILLASSSDLGHHMLRARNPQTELEQNDTETIE